MTSVDNALQACLQPLGLPVFPNLYEGTELEYIVTNHTTIPTVFADRLPAAARHLVTVRYFLPFEKNPNPTLLAIESALSGAGFTWPSVMEASDSAGQAWVLECEYVNAGGVYGYT